MQPRLICSSKALPVIIFFCFFRMTAVGQAILFTDSSDYHPGSTVNINGSGFAPGETVVLQVTHVTGGNNETNEAHLPWNVVADQSGNITAKWVVPIDQDELGASLLLTANGTASLLHAEKYFTDAVVTVTTTNKSWSSLSITSSDAVVIKGGGSLIVDVPDAVCASIKIGGANTDGAAGNAGSGTLIFNSGTQLTVNGIVTVGASDGSSFIGTLNMANGGKLVCNGFAKAGTATQVLTPGTGTIELNATNTLLLDFQTYNNLTIAAGTTSLRYAGKANGMLAVMAGAVLDLSQLNFKAGALSGSGTITNISSFGTGKNTLSVGTNNSNFTFSGLISDGTNGRQIVFDKAGTGTVTLNSANTYTGNTTVSGGTIAIGNSAALSTSAIVLGGVNTPTLMASGAPRTIDNDVWVSLAQTGFPTIGGTNDLTVTGKLINWTPDGTFNITNTGTTTFSGPIILSNDPALTKKIFFSGSGKIILNGIIKNCEGAGVSSSLGFDGNFSGTAIINGVNTHSGNTSLSNGTFVLGNKNVFGTSAVYFLNASISAATDLTGVNSIVNRVIMNGSPIFTGSNSINFSSGWTNSISNTLTANINGGLLSIGDTLILAGYTPNSTLTVNGAGTISIPAVIANGTGSTASNLTYSGTGTLIIGSSANIYSGTTKVNSGELRINPVTATSTFASKILLNGGKLSSKNIVSNAIWSSSATLTLNSNSSIELGATQHSLKFADSHSVTWLGSTLTINGWNGSAGGRIFFGNDATALTAAQLAKIGFAGYSGPAMLLNTGELVPAIQCTTPLISTFPSGQPGNQSISYGDNANYTVVATGTPPLTYNWRVSKDAGSTYSNITGESFPGYGGATTSSLTMTKPTVAMSNYLYECVITNGCGSVTSASALLTVTPKQVNVSISASDKQYDGTTNAVATAINPVAGILDGDNVVATAINGIFDSKNVGQRTVTADLLLSGADAGNYSFNPTASVSADITQKPVIVKTTASSRIYDGSRNAVVDAVNPINGLLEDDDVTAIAVNGMFDSRDAGLSKTVTANISLGGADAYNYSYNATANAVADITPLEIIGSFTADEKIYDGDINATVLTRSLAGVIETDDVSLTGGTASFLDSKAAGGKVVSLTGSTLTGADAANYNLKGVSTATSSIRQRPITIAVTSTRKTYGDVDPQFATEVVAGAVVNGDLPTGSIERETGENVGTYQITQGTYTYGDNYAETFVPEPFNIDPLAVTVTAVARTKTYGDSDPSFTYASLPAVGTLLPNAEVIGFAGELSRVNGETVQGSPYTIKQGSLSNSNYTISYTEADLTITPASLTVNVDNKSKEYGAPIPLLTGSITGVKGSDEITVVYHTDATETSDVVSCGYPITATFDDLNNKVSNYTLNYVPGVLTITRANPIITVTGYEGVYDGNPHGVVTTSAKGSANVDLNAFLHIASTTYINFPGGAIHWDFEGNSNYNSISGEATVNIKKAGANISVNAYSVAYDGKPHVSTGTASGVEDSPIDLSDLLSLSGTTHTSAGDYDFDEWSFEGNINYNPANGTVHNRISKAGTDATVVVNDFIYDGNSHPASASVIGSGGLAQPLTVMYLGIETTNYGPSDVAPTNAGRYRAITVFEGDANREGSTDTKSFTIGKADPVIIVTPYKLTFDGAEHSAVVTALGLEPTPVDLTALVDVTHTIHKNAGAYPGDYWSFAGNDNYNAVSNTTIEDVIAKAASETEVTIDGGPFTYTGTAITPATVVVTGIGGLRVSTSANYRNNINAGTATASYVFEGDENHFSSSDTETFSIVKKQLTVTAENKSKVYDGQTFVNGGGSYSASITGFVKPDTLESSGISGSPVFTGPATLVVDYGTHTITPTLGTLEATNYSFAFVNGTLEISKRSLDLTGSKEYDGNSRFPASALVPSNVVGNDVVQIDGSATVSNKVVGNYTSFATSTLSCSNPNYQLSGGTINVAIKQKPLTVTATGIDKVYDGNTDASVNLSSDRVPGDDVNFSFSVASFADPGAGTRDVIVTGILISGTDAVNYTLGNSICRTSANITKANTLSILRSSAASVRYMDQLTLTATITPANIGSALTGTVQFKIGSILFGSPVTVVPVPNDPAGAVQASFMGQVTTLPTASCTIEAVFASTNQNYGNSSDTKLLQVTQRDADPYYVNLGFYTGEVFAWTTGQNSSSGTIKLSTTVKDNGSIPGDVRAAKVTFYLVSTSGITPIQGATNLPVGLVDVDDGTIGTASAIVQLNIGANNAQNFKVAVGVSGAYKNRISDADAQAIVTVSKPVAGGYMVCGGRTENLYSSGYIRGDAGALTEFEADIVYTKSGTNPKGKADVLIRSHYKTAGSLDSKPHTYIINTNAIASLNVAGTAPATATFSSKANLYEQLADMSLVLIEGGAVFEMIVTQQCGVQQAGITLYRKAGGVWFSTNWNGTKTLLQKLADGHASVAGGACGKTVASTLVIKEKAPAENVEVSVANAKVYPNPTASQFNIKLESVNKTDAISIVVYDVNGKVVQQRRNLTAGETIQLGSLYRPGVYILEIMQGEKRKQLKLLKIPD